MQILSSICGMKYQQKILYGSLKFIILLGWWFWRWRVRYSCLKCACVHASSVLVPEQSLVQYKLASECCLTELCIPLQDILTHIFFLGSRTKSKMRGSNSCVLRKYVCRSNQAGLGICV